MTDYIISWEDSVDPPACNSNPTKYNTVSRDPVRTPFQWDATRNAGFSWGKKTWLPVNINYYCVNVVVQRITKKSHLKVYKKLNEIRNLPSLVSGNFEPVLLGNDVLAYKRCVSFSLQQKHLSPLF